MSTLWIDQKYASLVGTQLQQFKVVKTKPYIAKFRCPICGDSSKNRFKTRGHFYEHKGHINFKCFNCGASTTLNGFIKSQNVSLHTEYRLEILKETGGANTHINNDVEKFIPAIEKFSSRRIDSFEPFKELSKISQLKPDHPAKIYVQNRKIPPNTHFRIYYSPIYYTWVNSILPGKFSEKAIALDEPRIVFPFIDSKGYVFGFTGRSLSKSTNMRYSTIILDESKEKVFGLETINKDRNVYVVEGPIDSLFLDNCIAMAGSDINLNNITNKNNLTVVYDNEPRNKEIVNKISKAIDMGHKVCIWPDFIEHKDINDMVLKQDLSGPAIQSIIDSNTFSGLAAKMRLQVWSKV
jgi:transcription elongation factor Elf1